jgi:uncharacterized protein
MIISRQISLLIFLAFFVTVHSSCQQGGKDSLPKPTGFVNDFENVFLTAEKYFLDSMIAGYEAKTTVQIAVITVDTTMTSLVEFDNYILRILKKWGVGQKEKNNGIVIGISRGYRKIRVENGYGIEKMLSNDETKAIIDTAFIPSFKNGHYFEGVVKGLQAIMSKLD